MMTGWTGAPAIAMLLLVTLASGCSSEKPAAPAVPAAAAVPRSQDGLVTVTGKAPRGAVVALEPSNPVASAPPPGVIMDQRGQQFLPAVLVAQVGQAVEFRNGEGIVHNVYVTKNAGGAVELNVSTDPGQAHTHVFTTVGTYEVSCDIHPSMRASIAVVNTPHSVISGDFGAFTLMNIPPGSYEFVTLHGTEASRRPVQVQGTHTDLSSTAR